MTSAPEDSGCIDSAARIHCVNRHKRLITGYRGTDGWVRWAMLMAPAVVGLGLVLYVARAAKKRRRHPIVSNAKNGASREAPLQQLEAELSEASPEPATHGGTFLIDLPVASIPDGSLIEEGSVSFQTNLPETYQLPRCRPRQAGICLTPFLRIPLHVAI